MEINLLFSVICNRIKVMGFRTFILSKSIFFLAAFMLTHNIGVAQCTFASNPTILKTFGSGTAQFGTADPEDYNFTTSYTKEPGTINDAPQDGLYSFVNSLPDPWNVWHGGATDHTGDPNGYMMLVNADYTPGEFYRDTIMGLCQGIDYEFSAWVANADVNTGRIMPNVKFEIRDANSGALIEDYETGDVGVFPVLTWQKYSLTFNTNVEDVVLLLINNNPGGSGNDLVLDDIGFTPCLPSYNVTGPDSLCEGEDFTFQTNATIGYANPEYQWQKKIAGVWTDINGEKNNSYTKTNIVSADSGWYRAVIAETGNLDSELCNTKDSIHLSMKTSSISDRGSIADDQTICYNTVPDPFTSNQDAVSILPITYSWERSEDLTNWTSFAVNSVGYTETSALTQDTTYYRRKVSTSCTSAYSDTLIVSVLPEFQPGAVSDDQFLCEGESPVQFIETLATTGGDGDYAYQWEISDDSLSWTEITGATSDTYLPTAVTQDQWYRRRDSDGECATVVTEDVTIQDRVRYTNALKITHQITPQPLAQEIEQCQNTAVQTLSATGTDLLWYNSATGGTGSATIPTYSSAIADTLFFYVSQTLNTCESERDTLQIIIHPEPQLSVKDTAVCAGNEAQLNYNVVNTTGSYNYTWLPTTTLNIIDQNTVVAKPATTTQYQLEVEDDAGCIDTETITVTINSNPKVEVDDVDLCAENDTLLQATTTNGTGTITYVWENKVGLVSSNLNEATVKPTTTTSYKVVVEDQNSCKDSTNATVTLFPKPEITTSDLLLCKGEEASLNFNATQTTGDYNYNWTPTTNLDIQDRDNVRVNALSDQLYTLTLEDSKGCKDTATIDLVLHPEVNVTVPSIDLCAEKDTVLKAVATGGTGVLSYQWNNASGFLSASSNEASVQPLATQEYEVVVMDANSCKDTATSIVTVFPKPKLTINGNDVCSGTAAQLTSSVSNHSGGLVYSWSPSTGLNSTTNANVVSNVTTPTNYTLIIKDGKGCRDTATTRVGVTQTPLANIPHNDTLICVGDQVSFSAYDDPSENYSFTWFVESSNGVSNQLSSSRDVNLDEPGRYYVEVRNNGSCPVLSNTVVVNVEEISVTAQASTNEIYEGESVNLNAISRGNIVQYTWETPNGINSNSSFTISPTDDFLYKVDVAGNKCKASDTVRVTVLPAIIIPNGFSPDFDGKNDAWFIKGLSEFPNAEVQIFNRWGSIVYTYKGGYSHPWEGTNTKGDILPLGTYYYVIDVKDKKGQVFKGSVTIIN